MNRALEGFLAHKLHTLPSEILLGCIPSGVKTGRIRQTIHSHNRAAQGAAQEAEMIVGVPKEIKDNEARVGLTPAGAEALVAAGHTVLVEQSAGEASGFPDADYAAAGATPGTPPSRMPRPPCSFSR